MAGAVWPPVFERVISYAGRRQTMLWFGVCQLLVIAPFAAIFPARCSRLVLGRISRVVGTDDGLLVRGGGRGGSPVAGSTPL